MSDYELNKEEDNALWDALESSTKLVSEPSQEELIKGLKHNLSVIRSELIQIDEKQCSKSAWDRVCLALEFADT